MREQFEAAMAAGELLEMLESLPRGAVEASVRLMRGYTHPHGQKHKISLSPARTGEWPEPILTHYSCSPAPQRGRSPSPADEWSDGFEWIVPESEGSGGEHK